MAKVKDYEDWNRIIMNDKAIVPKDLISMSKRQISRLENLEVILENDGDLIVSQS